jgi:hypothetical protein
MKDDRYMIDRYTEGERDEEGVHIAKSKTF